MRECPCGSGLPREPLYDARGIFVAYVCDKCVDRKKRQYRADIFTDPNYWTDEPVESEDGDDFGCLCGAPTRLFYYLFPGMGVAGGPIQADSLANARQRLQKIFGKLPRRTQVWETTREEMDALDADRRRDPLLYRD